MEWYWIVIMIVGYLVIAGIAGGIVSYISCDEQDMPMGLIWPVLLPIGIFVGIARLTEYLLEK